MSKKTIKDLGLNHELMSVVFVDKETTSLIVHIHGFDSDEQASGFAKIMIENSGMTFKADSDLFDSNITIH